MKKYSFLILLILFSLSLLIAQEQASVEQLFGRYDPAADPQLQLQIAVKEATSTHKRILLDIGGEWCIWCHRLDTLFIKNPDVTEFLKKNFVLVKINFSNENDNEQFLSKYPKVAGYPHIFVLETDGTLLHSQETGALEKGKGHDRDKVLEFLTKWARKK